MVCYFGQESFCKSHLRELVLTATGRFFRTLVLLKSVLSISPTDFDIS